MRVNILTMLKFNYTGVKPKYLAGWLLNATRDCIEMTLFCALLTSTGYTETGLSIVAMAIQTISLALYSLNTTNRLTNLIACVSSPSSHKSHVFRILHKPTITFTIYPKHN